MFDSFGDAENQELYKSPADFLKFFRRKNSYIRVLEDENYSPQDKNTSGVQ